MKDYKEYYELSKKIYAEQNAKNLTKLNLYDLTMKVIFPNQESELIKVPSNYLSLIDSISKAINKKISDESEHYMESTQESKPKVAIQVRNIWDIPELSELVDFILPSLEQNVFGSYIHLAAVHAYRNIQTSSPRLSSWLWHYDNNPKEAVKVLIYLTDVGENNAPFELLEKEGQHIKIETSRTGYSHWRPPLIPESRIPKTMIDVLKQKGYKEKKILGPAGTILFFDNNIIHRANSPTEGYRDAIILNIRPSSKKIRPFLSKNVTGSWMHKDPIVDPSNQTPTLK